MSRALRNINGNVLKNSNGRIMRANYDFGKGITGVIEATVPALVGKQYDRYSQEIWYKNPGSLNHGYTMLVTEQGTGFSTGYQASGKLHFGTITTQNAVLVSTGLSTKNYGAFRMVAATGVGDTYYPAIGEKKSTGISPFAAFNSPIVEFRIGKGKLAHLAAGSFNLLGNSELPLVRLYSRLLDDTEPANNYNKGIGADAVSGSALLIELRFNRAEMLDFSAAQDAFRKHIPLNHLGNLAAAPAAPAENNLYYDTTLAYSRIWTGNTWRKIGTEPGEADIRLGCRNFGSLINGHAILHGLPAGNMLERMNYANANHFKSFN